MERARARKHEASEGDRSRASRPPHVYVHRTVCAAVVSGVASLPKLNVAVGTPLTEQWLRPGLDGARKLGVLRFRRVPRHSAMLWAVE